MDDPVRPSQVAVSKPSQEEDGERVRIAERRRLSPQRLRLALCGDLDAIIGMAMRKEPDRRYHSVDAMADDIHRHLHGRPVRARQGDWRYYAAKFLRRHTLGAFVVSAVIVGLAAITGMTLWQNHRIELARLQTERERNVAQNVSAFLVDDVFSQADPFTAQGHEPSARDLLDRGARQILENAKLQPEVRAQLLESIGQAYRRLGLERPRRPDVRARRHHPPRGAATGCASYGGHACQLGAGVDGRRSPGIRRSISASGAGTVAAAAIPPRRSRPPTSWRQFGQFKLERQERSPRGVRRFSRGPWHLPRSVGAAKSSGCTLQFTFGKQAAPLVPNALVAFKL